MDFALLKLCFMVMALKFPGRFGVLLVLLLETHVFMATGPQTPGVVVEGPLRIGFFPL